MKIILKYNQLSKFQEEQQKYAFMQQNMKNILKVKKKIKMKSIF